MPYDTKGLTNRRRAAHPACLAHRLPSLNRVVPQHPPPSHRLRRIWRQRSASVSSRCSYSSNRTQAGGKKPSFMRTKRPTDLRIQQAGFLIPLFYLRESQIVIQSLGEWNLSNHEQAIIDGSRSLLLENHGKNFPQQSPSRIARNDVRVFAAHAFLYRAEFSAIGNRQRRSGGTHMGHDILQADALLRRLDDSQTRYRESPQFGRSTNSQCTNSRNNVVQSGKCLGLNNTNCVLSYTSVGDPASNRS